MHLTCVCVFVEKVSITRKLKQWGLLCYCGRIAALKMNHLMSFCGVGFIVLSFFISSFQDSTSAEHTSQEVAGYVTPTYLNFTFTWGSGTQSIVDGTLTMRILLEPLYGSADISDNCCSLLIAVRINDDEYNPEDYVGIVFDRNENGMIDSGNALCGYADIPLALFANNTTLPSFLANNGLLCPMPIELGTMPYEPRPASLLWGCTFKPEIGYTFLLAPCFISTVLKAGANVMHVCFWDENGGGFYSRFSFQLKDQ